MKRYPGLDLLRAVAISWVMLFHAGSEGLGTPLRPVGQIGWMAVDLFFVLSGYLIGVQLFAAFAKLGARPIRTFYVRRALRILPVYVTVVAAYTWLPFAREHHGFGPAWQFLTFTENFLIDYQHNQALSHAWSLCVEEHFYWFFPLIAWALLRIGSWRLTAGICVAILAGGIAYRWYAWADLLQGGAVMRTNPFRFVELVYYPTIARADGLLAGVVLATVKCYRPAIWSSAMARPYTLLAAAITVTAVAIGVAAPRVAFAPVVFGFPLLALGFALLVAAATSPHGVLGRVEIPGARFLATITFSLYLSHKLTWHVLHTYASPLVPAHTVQAFFVYWLSAVIVGTAIYFAVERPFLRLRDRRRSTAAIPATAEYVPAK